MNYLMLGANIVLIGLVIVFKQQIAGIVEDVFKAIREDTRVITN